MAESISAKTAWALAKAIKGDSKKKMPNSGNATVVRVDQDGTHWVRIFGSDVETPVNGSITADARPGDTVQYRLEDTRISITGNATSPSVGGTYVNQAVAPVERKADTALTEASRAKEAADVAEAEAYRARIAADSAQDSADTAASAASSAQSSADEALTSARSANASANSALTQLSIVEDVSGTLSWIRDHGTYRATTDTTVHEGTVYFELVSGDYVPISSPDPSANPQSLGWYVLDVTDSQTDYIMAHLAVTSAGLWVLPSGIGQAADAQHAAGYKALLAANGMTVYDGTGTAVVTYGSSTTFSTDRDWMVGNQQAFVFYDASENTLQIGGANVTIGGKAPADLLTSLDVSATQTSTGADITVNGTTVSLTNGAQGPQGPQGQTGPQGQAGPSGTSVTVTSIQYGTSSSASTQPSNWSTTVPTSITKGLWLWVKTNYSDNTSATTKSYVGTDGEEGPSGDDGVSVTGMEHQYYLSTSSSSQTGGSWSVTPADYVSGRYYWERWKITFSDSSTPTYTTATLAKEVTSAWTAIETNSTNIALKANSADVYTSTAVDGLISQEVTDRNAAIQVSANAINSVVSTKVGADEVISSINQSSESVSISASKVNLTGAVTISDLASDASGALTDAAKTATDYVTNITGGGIMVHPSGDATTGVQITDDVDILRDGTSVINIGDDDAIRIGASGNVQMHLESGGLEIDNENGDEIFAIDSGSTGSVTISLVATLVTWNATADVSTTAYTVSDAGAAAGDAVVTATVDGTEYPLDSTYATATVTAGTGVSVALTSAGVTYVQGIMADAEVTTGELSVEYQHAVTDIALLSLIGSQAIDGEGELLQITNSEWVANSRQSSTLMRLHNATTGRGLKLGVGSNGYTRGVFDSQKGDWIIARNRDDKTVINGPNFSADASGVVSTGKKVIARGNKKVALASSVTSGSTNRGLWDETGGKWIIYQHTSYGIVLGNSVSDTLYKRTATCTVNSTNAAIANNVNHCWNNAACCSVAICINLKASMANNNLLEVATAPSGYRPPYTFYGSAYVTGQTVNLQTRIDEDGKIYVNNRSGSTVNTSANIYLSFTFAP